MIMSFHLSLELATQFSHHIRYCRDIFWGAFVVVVWALGRMGREKKERFSSLFSPIPSHRSLRSGSASFSQTCYEIDSGLWMRWNVTIRACPDFSCFLWCVFCNFVCLFFLFCYFVFVCELLLETGWWDRFTCSGGIWRVLVNSGFFSSFYCLFTLQEYAVVVAIPKTSKYHVIFHYALRNNQRSSAKVELYLRGTISYPNFSWLRLT